MRRSLIPAVLLLGLLWAGVAAAAAGTVVTSQKTSIGNAITTAGGRTLYLFRGDHGTTSECYGKCAIFWPPLLTTGRPAASGTAKGSLLGTTKRKDGRVQVTYKGHPLYTFLKDKKAGQTTGEGVDGFGARWYALAPSGATIDRD